MNLKFFVSLCLAGVCAGAMAQGYKDGIEYYKADRYVNAKELLNRNLNAAGTDKSASYYYLGMIDVQDNKLSDAAANFEKGLQANPDYAYNYVGLGYLNLLNGDKKLAEKNFKEAESKGKKDTGVEMAIARAYYKADPVGNAKEVEKRITKAQRNNLEAYEIYMLQGDMAADNKKWGESAGYYEMAAGYAPDATEAYVKGADTYLQVNPEYAINLLKKLLSLNPNSALGRRELANTYYDLNRYKEAAEEYGKYINNPNHFARDEDRYAFLLFYGEDYQKGYDYATKLLASDPTNFSAMRFQFMNAAQLPSMSDKLLPLAENLYSAHKANKDNEFAPIDFTLVADEFARDKRFDLAKEVYAEAMSTYPQNTTFAKDLAMMYVDAEQYADAAKAYKNYLSKIKPEYNDYIQQATLSYYGAVSTKDSDPALSESLINETVEFAKKAEADYPEIYRPNKIYGDVKRFKSTKDNIGKAAAQDYQAAIDKLEKMENPERFSRDAKELYNYMGNYYLDQKNTEKAKTYFMKYLEYDKDNADYRKFVDSLK